MNDIVVKKLKKYVLFMSTIFFIALGTHLTYIYLYEGADRKAEVGWTISEAIIGTFPHFNPLVISTDHNHYINSLLYRSVLKYNPSTQNLEPDLMSCNVENISSISCILENNIKWSDGTSITLDDIEATYKIIEETKVNPIIASLLENTKITRDEQWLTFSNTQADINSLQILLQSIVPKKVLETLDSETIDANFSEKNGIYSGYFTVSSVTQDDTLGITKITLWKNKSYFNNPLYIDYLILNLFRDEAHLMKNKNSFNIFHDKNSIIGDNIPRLSPHTYITSQFVGTFFNSVQVPKELRNYISQYISREDIISQLQESKVSAAYNPFLTERNIDSQELTSIESYLEKKGYYSKKELLKSALAKEIQSEESRNDVKVVPPVVPESVPEKNTKVQSELTYVNSPNTQKYNFISEDNVLVSGSVPPWIDAVYINDHKLNGYTAWDDIFHYRLLESYDSILEGENTYKVYFESAGKKTLMEEFIYVFQKDTSKLEEIKKSYFNPISAPVAQSASGVQTTPPEKEIPKNQNLDAKVKDLALSSEEIEKLSDVSYYNAKGEKYSLRLIYPLDDPQIQETANIIQSLLEKNGVGLEIEGVSLGDITQWLRTGSIKYDMILIGINLWIFDSNLFPYFHSSQVENGYNFSNFKKLSLDILLEEMNSKVLNTSERQERETKVLDILQEENLLKALYTPNLSVYVDRNIKNFSIPTYLTDSSYRTSGILQSYLSEDKSIQYDTKSIGWFFYYIISKLFS